MAHVTTVPETTPTIHAPARAARRPERAANSSTKPASARGASETTKPAASAATPDEATKRSSRLRCRGTRLPSCQMRAPVGQSEAQSAPENAVNQPSTRGTRTTPRPMTAATTASTAARTATRRRFMIGIETTSPDARGRGAHADGGCGCPVNRLPPDRAEPCYAARPKCALMPRRGVCSRSSHGGGTNHTSPLTPRPRTSMPQPSSCTR